MGLAPRECPDNERRSGECAAVLEGVGRGDWRAAGLEPLAGEREREERGGEERKRKRRGEGRRARGEERRGEERSACAHMRPCQSWVGGLAWVRPQKRRALAPRLPGGVQPADDGMRRERHAT